MLNWNKITRLVIPEGVVRKITSGGVVLWGRFVSLGKAFAKDIMSVLVMIKHGVAIQHDLQWMARLSGKVKLIALDFSTIFMGLASTLHNKTVMVAKQAKQYISKTGIHMRSNAEVATEKGEMGKSGNKGIVYTAFVFCASIYGRILESINRRLSFKFTPKTRLSSDGKSSQTKPKTLAKLLPKVFGGSGAIPQRLEKTTFRPRLRQTIVEEKSSKIKTIIEARLRPKVFRGNGAISFAYIGTKIHEIAKGISHAPDFFKQKTSVVFHKFLVLIGKVPDVLHAKQHINNEKLFVRTFGGKSVNATVGENINPHIRLAGLIRNVSKRMAVSAKKKFLLLMKAPDIVTSKIHHLTTLLLDNTLNGVLDAYRGQASKVVIGSVCNSNVTMSLTEVAWESPIQTDNELLITQAYSINQTDNRIKII